jgi:predicted nucleotidyltransferase
MNFHDLIKTFKIQPELNPKFWDERGKLNLVAKNAMIKAAKMFYDSIDLENKPEIVDIIFTGSLANYNWSKFSDVDLHLLFDFKQYGEHAELFEKYFLLAKAAWNLKHDVTVRGYEVEVYAEDYRNQHHSTGVYSLMTDRWVRVPQKKVPIFDPIDVEAKVKLISRQYNQLVDEFLNGDPDVAFDRINSFRKKLSKYRKSGLEKGGEFSTENITFKMLRRTGILDKLAKLHAKIIDNQLSVENKIVP